MRTVPATALRRDLFGTLKRLAYEKEPILIERRGRAIAALVPPETVLQAGGPSLDDDKQPEHVRRGALLLDPKELREFCTRHRLRVLYLFGSALTPDFDEESDVDLMFEPEDDGPSAFQQMNMADELEALLGRPVDLVSRRAVEESSNPFRKRAILGSAQVVYAR